MRCSNGKNCVTLLLIWMMFPWATFALEIHGTGTGSDSSSAKEEAMSDLARQIQAEVQSQIATEVILKGELIEAIASKKISVNSRLPMLGLEFKVKQQNNEFTALAILKSSKSLSLYENRIAELQQEMMASWNSLKNMEIRANQYESLLGLMALKENLTRHYIVAVALGSRQANTVTLSDAEINGLLASLETQVDSLDLAAKYLSKSFLQSQIYVDAILPKKSHEITQFSAILRDKIKSYLRFSDDETQAEHFLIGSYEVHPSGMDITVQLLNRQAEVVGMRTLFLLPKAYQEYAYEPQHFSFDQSLYHSSLHYYPDFRVAVRTHKNEQNTLFHEGEKVQFFVKLSAPGYFYIVGHTKNNVHELSYLLDLNNSQDQQTFVRKVEAEMTGQWLSAGEFAVTRPFGIESLQVIASTENFASLPDVKYDQKQDLHVIGRRNQEALRSARGIPSSASKQAKFAESVLMLSTLPVAGR